MGDSTSRDLHCHRSVRRLREKLDRALEELIELRLAGAGDEIPVGDPKVLLRTTVRGHPVAVVVLPGTELPPLTKRQKEVLRLLGHGHGNARIALILGIREDTVKFHLKSISKRWGLTSRAGRRCSTTERPAALAGCLGRHPKSGCREAFEQRSEKLEPRTIAESGSRRA